jgi:hypothetical protein
MKETIRKNAKAYKKGSKKHYRRYKNSFFKSRGFYGRGKRSRLNRQIALDKG